jgi:predicted nucleic acid-binding Zn ribbon protein
MANVDVDGGVLSETKRRQRKMMIVIASIAILGAILLAMGLRSLRASGLRQ